MATPRVFNAIVVVAVLADTVASLSLSNLRMQQDSHSAMPAAKPDGPHSEREKHIVKEAQALSQIREESERKRGRLVAADPDIAWNDKGLDPDLGTVPVFNSDFDLDFMNWSLCNASYHSNLAGLGPDSGEESIRYYNIATSQGQGVDLVVTANGSYVAKDPTINGLVSGDSCFGVVNLKSHFSGYREVPLLFSLYLTGTNTSVALDRFFVTVYDFDSGTTATEHATFFNRVQQIYHVPDHEMDIEGNLSSVGLTFTSTMQGTGRDNPKDPMHLTDEQKKRAVMVEYANQTQWRINFAVSGGKSGRNFVFASKSDLPLAGLTTTTTTTSCDISTCIVWADPHVSGFDNTDNQGPGYLALMKGVNQGTGRSQLHTFDQKPIDLDELEVGDFWLVKSEPVFIQGRFRISPDFNPSQAAIGAVAVGGPFIHNRTIVVEPLDGQVTVDGLVAPDGSWTDATGTISVRRASAEDVELELPMNLKLTFKRFPKHIDVSITMPHISGGVDGECGNYDGIAENDDVGGVRGRMGSVLVDDSMLLFSTKFDEVTEELTEQDYEAVVSLHDDGAMAEFVRFVLASENKMVPPEDESELEGFVQWFSGTKATQSFEEMRQELATKSWVRTASKPGANAAPAGAKMLTASPAAADESTCSDCLVWGASHILSFGAFRQHAALHPKREALFRAQDWARRKQLIAEAGTYWLVKTSNLQIQGRFWRTGSGIVNLGALAVGGSLLEGNRLIIRSGDAMWNDDYILTGFPSNFTNSFVAAEYTRQHGPVGAEMKFTFKNGISIAVQPHNKVLDAKIRMCESFLGVGTTEGQCGSLEAQAQTSNQAKLKLKAHEIIFPDGASRSFHVGDRVKVRDDDKSDWMPGTVTSLDPVKVLPDFFTTDYEWSSVERI